MIYVNKIEKRIAFKIKTSCYLEILMHETIKFLRSPKIKITKDENGENVSRLEMTEVIVVHCNIANNNYHQDSRVLYTIVPNKSFDQLLDISQEFYIFKTF